jgi:hypothetical protein
MEKPKFLNVDVIGCGFLWKAALAVIPVVPYCGTLAAAA